MTVGEAGKGLASATLALGIRTGTTAETGSDKAGGDGIKLVVEAFNSLGEKANNADVTSVTVIAVGADMITISSAMSDEGALTVSVAGGDTVTQKTTVTVDKDKAGTVDVYALVIGKDGTDTTETITLTFTGDPETHSTAAPGDGLAQADDVYQAAVEDDTSTTEADESADAVEGGLKFEVTGADSADNQAALTLARISSKVLDADGKNVSSKFSIGEEIKANSQGVVIIRVGTGSAKLDAGTYTAGDEADRQGHTADRICGLRFPCRRGA